MKKYRSIVDINDNSKIEATPTFLKELSGLKRYCMRSYKDLIFHIGDDGIRNFKHKSNKIDILTDPDFKAIHGQIKLVFEKRNKVIYLLAIEPEAIFLVGYMKNLEIYRGVPIMNEKDRFKVEILKRVEALND